MPRQTGDLYSRVKLLTVCNVQSDCYLLFLSVKLKALSKGAGLRLMVLFSVQIDTLSIWNILLLCVSKQTVGKQSTVFIKNQGRIIGMAFRLAKVKCELLNC